MYPPIYQLARDDAAVTALLGSPPRFRPFGHYDQNGPRPYAVWQVIYGNPDNSLSCAPKEDLYGVQVDAYATTEEEARAVAAALRNAVESDHNPVVGYNGEFWEQATDLYRVSFTCEFWTER